MFSKRIQNLRHRITILENTAMGELQSESWCQKIQLYCDIQPVSFGNSSTSDKVGFDHVITEELFIFHTRFTEGLNCKMRIRFKNRLFNIKRILNLKERDRWLRIIAAEILT